MPLIQFQFLNGTINAGQSNEAGVVRSSFNSSMVQLTRESGIRTSE